jgi:hypothetical protein
MAPEVRCAEQSRQRNEVMAGTASRVVRWLLLEQPGAWGREALIESRLDEMTGRVLQSAARRHAFRALLIRRPGWQRGNGSQRVYLAHTDRRRPGWIEQLDVEDPAELFHLDWDALDSPTPPGIGRPGPAAVHLVCTNGRHDPCCADLGRPVVRALADAGVPEVWESSHVGGDRFAANVVSLPSGVYYGRVEPAEAAGLLEDLGAGLLHLERYRGRSCFPPMVQAAEYHTRLRLGERRFDALRVVAAERRGPDGLAVRLEHEGRVVLASIVRQRAEACSLSCGAAPSPPWRYLLDRFEDPAP